LVVLIIYWKQEIVGAITFTFAGLMYICLIIFRVNNIGWATFFIWSLIIASPAILVGILFFVNWKQNKRNARKRK